MSPLFSIWILATLIMQKFESGTWKLSGSPEMSCMFRFEKNGRFQFSYIYGAVDRMAGGTYSVDGDTIKLNSNKIPGQDVNVTKSEKRNGNIIIRIMDGTDFLKQYAIAYYGTQEKYERVGSDKNGIIEIPHNSAPQVWVSHSLFPDFPTLIKDENSNDTYFEVSYKPSLAEVSFKGIDLFIKEGYITCLPNSLLPFEDIRFYKID